MDFFELAAIAVGLSLDAFAVSVCKGLAMGRAPFKTAATAGLWFGGFQALMPLIGYLVGQTFERYIVKFDHWIAFALLGLIGLGMIWGAFSKEERDSEKDRSLKARDMLPLAIATSIDALAVGVTFAFLRVRIIPAVIVIGVITFILSALGIKAGGLFGSKYKKAAEIAGGAVLALLGVKILLEHLGVIAF